MEWWRWGLGGAVLVFSMVPRFHRVSYSILRWPLLGLIYSLILAELCLYVSLRLLVRFLELAETPAHRKLRRALRMASTYDEWLASAKALDASKDAQRWQSDLRSTRYNWPFVRDMITRLRDGRAAGDWRSVVSTLRLCARPNVAGVMHPQLYSATYAGDPKTIISDFVRETVDAIRWIAPNDDDAVRKALLAARESYGKTVLSLSGGGALGTYHFGVVRAMWAEGCLPETVCGTSAGAIVAAFVATRTEAELVSQLFDDDLLRSNLRAFDRGPIEMASSFLRTGAAYDTDRWLEIIRWFANEEGVKDMTFAEAYSRSGRNLAITVCARGKRAPPVLLTRHSSPHVLVSSAILASCGVPGLIKPCGLFEKESGSAVTPQNGETYMDGSIVHDIPTKGLLEAFNARFVIASQVNPHIVPMLYQTNGNVGDPTRWSSPRHEDAWRGGFAVAALELFLRSCMLSQLEFLRDVDATPGWTGKFLTQNFEGTVTITPALHFRDYFESLKNPTKTSMARFLREGRIAAYQKMYMIRTRYAIERAIDRALGGAGGRLESDDDSFTDDGA
ncbi:hypothetical protein CTAYLR_008100 [Chrysophaeum taylorii]|uniref:PNPLA domain-containing protein n=1 Tax=Chrysophaeum taylorii TaxID=2483200 RepID=A0AAD7UCH5_9STRA|nr:hypothetical protein CTAYLR_008100 [Chrysophaeum taylorii]